MILWACSSSRNSWRTRQRPSLHIWCTPLRITAHRKKKRLFSSMIQEITCWLCLTLVTSLKKLKQKLWMSRNQDICQPSDISKWKRNGHKLCLHLWKGACYGLFWKTLEICPFVSRNVPGSTTERNVSNISTVCSINIIIVPGSYSISSISRSSLDGQKNHLKTVGRKKNFNLIIYVEQCWA